MSKRILSLVLSLALSLFVFVFPVSAGYSGDQLLVARLYYSYSSDGVTWSSSWTPLIDSRAFQVPSSTYIRFDSILLLGGSDHPSETASLSGYVTFNLDVSPFAVIGVPTSSGSFNQYSGTCQYKSGSYSISGSPSGLHGYNFYFHSSIIRSYGPFLESISLLPGFSKVSGGVEGHSSFSWTLDDLCVVLPLSHPRFTFGCDLEPDQSDVSFTFSKPPVFVWTDSSYNHSYIVFDVSTSFYPSYREHLAMLSEIDSDFLKFYGEWQSYYDYFVEDFNQTMQRKLDNLVQDSDDISHRMSDHDDLTDAAFDKGKDSYDYYQESAQDGYDSAQGAFSIVSDGAPGFNPAGFGDSSGGIWYSQAVADALHDPSLNTRGSPTVIDYYSGALKDYRKRLSELLGGDSSD